MTHLFARLASHDNGWDLCICQNPQINGSWIINETNQEQGNDKLERDNAGSNINDLTEWAPPCSRDIFTYSLRGSNSTHKDPVNRDYLGPTIEEIPPYTNLPARYRCLREETFRDTCESEGLAIRTSDNIEKERGRVYEPDRQMALLEHFWGNDIFALTCIVQDSLFYRQV